MRTGLALILSLALAVTPALAQGKTKAPVADEALAALAVCEAFARGEDGAMDAAIAAGWDAYDEQSESPYITQYGGSREIPGMGWGDLFVLLESYPTSTLGYCRLDVAQPRGNGKSVIEAIAGLEGYQGDVTREGVGTYASLEGTGPDQSLLIAHWDDVGFVIQLTLVTPKSAPSVK